MANSTIEERIEADVGQEVFRLSNEAIPFEFALTKSEAGIIAFVLFATFLVFVAYWLSCMGGDKRVNKILKTLGVK